MLTIEQIQNIVSDYFRDKPVKRVYLFGSYARGDAKENSDIDLLVDLDKNVGLRFYGWNEELKNKFSQKIDMIPNADRPEHVSNWNFIVRINKEKYLLYEKRGRR